MTSELCERRGGDGRGAVINLPVEKQGVSVWNNGGWLGVEIVGAFGENWRKKPSAA